MLACFSFLIKFFFVVLLLYRQTKIRCRREITTGSVLKMSRKTVSPHPLIITSKSLKKKRVSELVHTRGWGKKNTMETKLYVLPRGTSYIYIYRNPPEKYFASTTKLYNLSLFSPVFMCVCVFPQQAILLRMVLKKIAPKE